MYKFSVEQLDDDAPETVIGLIEDAMGYFAAEDVLSLSEHLNKDSNIFKVAELVIK